MVNETHLCKIHKFIIEQPEGTFKMFTLFFYKLGKSIFLTHGLWSLLVTLSTYNYVEEVAGLVQGYTMPARLALFS